MERGGPSLDSGPGLNLARIQEKVVSLDNRMDSGLGLSIARQAELVFSDTAIARDAFLLKHIRRNRFCNLTKIYFFDDRLPMLQGRLCQLEVADLCLQADQETDP